MAATVNWVEFDGGLMGVLPCALVIHLIRFKKAEHYYAWRVRFATAELRETFDDVEDAKIAGKALARRIMTECLVAVEE